MQVFVEAVGALAPGIANWDAARALLAGRAPYAPAPLDPPVPQCLPGAERRRSSATVRLAIAAAEQALAQTPIAPRDMAMVFASYEAAGLITHQLCEVLASTRDVSPTQFHNSVHNAPSGYFSIAMGATRAASSVCRGEWSFAAGLLNAAAQAVADDLPVLFACYDSPLPAPLSDVMPVVESTAIALVLTPRRTAQSVAALDIALHPAADPPEWPAWMPRAWHANATARGFALLDLLSGAKPDAAGFPADAAARLPFSPELEVRATLVAAASDLARRVPHAGSMVLLDRVLAWDAQSIRCAAQSHRDAHNPLRENGVLPVWAAIEYAAQAAAVHGGLIQAGGANAGGPAPHAAALAAPRPGLLASLRDVRAFGDRLDTVAGELEVAATLRHGDPAGAVYAFEAGGAGRTLLTGQFTLMFGAPGAGDGR